MSETANFANNPRVSVATFGLSNTALDGSGSITTLFTAGANGSRINKISAKSVTSTASENMVRLFLKTSSTTAWFLFTEIPINTPLSSVSTMTDEQWQTFPDGISLPANASIGVTTHNANIVNVTIYAGDF